MKAGINLRTVISFPDPQPTSWCLSSRYQAQVARGAKRKSKAWTSKHYEYRYPGIAISTAASKQLVKVSDTTRDSKKSTEKNDLAAQLGNLLICS